MAAAANLHEHPRRRSRRLLLAGSRFRPQTLAASVLVVTLAGVYLVFRSLAGSDGQIAYYLYSQGGSTNNQLVVANSDGSSPHQILPGVESFDWSPDHATLVVVRRIDGRSTISTVAADGGGLKDRSHPAADQNDTSPTWESDGSQIAYLRTIDSPSGQFIYQIHSLNTFTRTDISLISTTDQILSPSWSPAGGSLIYYDLTTGTIDQIGASGTVPKRLTPMGSDDGIYSWSPDGKRIAFTASAADGGGIYIMNSDGSHIALLAAGVSLAGYRGAEMFNQWSPDGHSLLAVGQSGAQTGHLMTIDVATKVQQVIELPDRLVKAASWSPLGDAIVLAMQAPGGPLDIYTTPVADTGLTTIVQSATSTPTDFDYSW